MVHQYKLTYFNLRAMGEPIRLIFKYAQVPFEDNRVERADWPAQKEKYLEVALGQMPILEVDGTMMTQSLAIARFMCNQLGLVSDKPVLNYKSDEVVHILEDLRMQCRPIIVQLFVSPRPAGLDAEIKTLAETVLPRFLKFVDKIIGETKGPYIAGDKPTVGDFVACNWMDIFLDIGVLTPSVLEKYSNLKGLKDALMSTPQIKEWVESRPKTPL